MSIVRYTSTSPNSGAVRAMHQIARATFDNASRLEGLPNVAVSSTGSWLDAESGNDGEE